MSELRKLVESRRRAGKKEEISHAKVSNRLLLFTGVKRECIAFLETSAGFSSERRDDQTNSLALRR